MKRCSIQSLPSRYISKIAPPTKEETLKPCQKAVDKCIVSCSRLQISTAFLFGQWLSTAHTLFKQQCNGSFNAWMNENTTVKKTRGNAYKGFYKNYKDYPKIIQCSTLPSSWCELHSKHLKEHPEEAEQWINHVCNVPD